MQKFPMHTWWNQNQHNMEIMYIDEVMRIYIYIIQNNENKECIGLNV